MAILVDTFEVGVQVHAARKWTMELMEVWRHIIVSPPDKTGFVTITCC